ncbi:MAG TPA: pirin family protein [Anaerolineae bacterium]|nr:pirin family protein [Anaerolineae bacterium]
MTKIRSVTRLIDPQPVLEGAGVRLKRSIATRTLDYLDPFLLLDHFGSDRPEDYLAGFPMHPHRGIETVTYMLAGRVFHRDSLGNSGSIQAGDVQWMTAGGGIMHEEMPQPVAGKMYGFQLWVNLPARHKMMRPRYQEIASAQIPEVLRPDGTRVRVIAGVVDGVQGAVRDIVADPTYLDVTLPPSITFTQPVPNGDSAFAYVFEGQGAFGAAQAEQVRSTRLAILEGGDVIEVRTGDQPVRFLLVSGKPLGEPIARYGPFVMTTRDEIEEALRDLRNGTFVR